MGLLKLSLALATVLLSPVLASPVGDYGGDDNGGPGLVRQKLELTWAPGAPDGNERMMIFTNGQFPAPPLVFDEDDDVEITVCNNMPANATVHWHGLEMRGTPWSDGVPGLTQKPIEPGQSYVYRFKAYPPGTYWYHSHTRTTLLDGLYGPLHIRRKNSNPTPWSAITNDTTQQAAIQQAAHDAKLVTVSDWSKATSDEYMKVEEESNLDIFVLVNGKGSVYCPGLDYLYKYVPPQLLETLDGKNVNDKGCLPFVPSTEGPFLPGNQSAIPFGFNEGCVATTGQREVIEVDPSQNSGWVSFNFVMAATFMAATVSVDEHDMWLYEVDGQLVEPRKIQAVTMYPGERFAVMMKLDKKPADYTMRVPSTLSQITSAFAVMRYKGGQPAPVVPGIIPKTTGFIDYGGFNTTPQYTVLDGAYTPIAPFPPNVPKAPEEGDDMHVLSLGRWEAPWRWTMSGQAIMPADAGAYDPVLYDPHSPLAMDQNLTIQTKNGSWVDLVLLVGQRPGEPQEISHAIHKHTTKTWLIGQGFGFWNYSSVAQAVKAEPNSFNLANPDYRDTVMTTFSGAAWFVLRYQVTNPGAWLLHCHVEVHLAGGMGMVIMDGVDKWPEIPPEYGLGRMGS